MEGGPSGSHFSINYRKNVVNNTAEKREWVLNCLPDCLSIVLRSALGTSYCNFHLHFFPIQELCFLKYFVFPLWQFQCNSEAQFKFKIQPGFRRTVNIKFQHKYLIKYSRPKNAKNKYNSHYFEFWSNNYCD